METIKIILWSLFVLGLIAFIFSVGVALHTRAMSWGVIGVFSAILIAVIILYFTGIINFNVFLTSPYLLAGLMSFIAIYHQTSA